MGQQQILLIVLSVILVGIAIAVGITMFQAQAESSNRDAITADIVNLASMAYQWRIRPTSMGGGGGTYYEVDGGGEAVIDIEEDWFNKLPADIKDNDNATYTFEEVVEDADAFSLRAVSKTHEDTNTVVATIDDSGTVTNWNWAPDPS